MRFDQEEELNRKDVVLKETVYTDVVEQKYAKAYCYQEQSVTRLNII